VEGVPEPVQTITQNQGDPAMERCEPDDYSGVIEMELDQLLTVGELVRHMPPPEGVRDEFLSGLADLIAGNVRRIKNMLPLTYDDIRLRAEKKGAAK
jgi:hypothetical protein